MRKVLMGAAVMAMFATSCQNEVVVDGVQSAGKSEFFTLEVGKGFESRTVLSGAATHWCEDDAIFVSGADGEVSGVLTFESYVGNDKSQAKFSGWISGGQPSELEHIVFPVPQGGKIDMAKRDPNKLDAPMIGTIGNGAVQTLKNVGGLVTFDTKGEVYDVEAISGTNNMSGGSYTFDPQAGTLTYVPGDDLVPTYVDEGGNAYVPVATTTEATNGTSETTLRNVKLNLVVDKQVVASADVDVTSGEIFGDGDDEDTGALDVNEITEESQLISAFETGGYVKLAKDIKMSQRLFLNEGKTLTIQGNKKTLDFSDAKGGDNNWGSAISNDRGTLNIENLSIVCRNLTENYNSYGIWSYGTAENPAYLTLEGCEVTGDDNAVVGIEGIHENAVVNGGLYKFDGTNGESRYAFRIQSGAYAEVNTTVDGGEYGGALDVNGASAYVEGIKFTGAGNNGQGGIHIYNSNVTLNEAKGAIECSDLYIRTSNEDAEKTASAASVVNEVTFNGGEGYEGYAYGFRGTLSKLFEYIAGINDK